MSDFRAFIELVIEERLEIEVGGKRKAVEKPEDLIALLQDPTGLHHRTVRHKLKEPLLEQLVNRSTDAKRLGTLPAYNEALAVTKDAKQALRAAAHAELVRISDKLPSSDRGSFGESWYERIYPPAEKTGSYTQIEVPPEQLNPQLPAGVAPLDQARRIDSLRQEVAFEIKNVSGPLGA